MHDAFILTAGVTATAAAVANVHAAAAVLTAAVANVLTAATVTIVPVTVPAVAATVLTAHARSDFPFRPFLQSGFDSAVDDQRLDDSQNRNAEEN
ncbi:MAG: hypothetical protein FWE59_06270, partial [Oscillospiraceae bacterium]|nr:hypothetical protein [Oscillospiraceae bacterium]